ncbi:MAG: MFS transporter [Dehalococcoidia bacterium]
MNKRPDDISDSNSEFGENEVRQYSGRRFRTFASFRNPMYRLYYYSLVGHWAPMNMQMVTRSLLIYRLTGSGALLGLMALAGALPLLFLSLYGGAIADRVNKKKVLIYGQLASALVTFAVALALSLGFLSKDIPGSWWILMVTSFLQGIVMGLMMPSRAAFVPEIVSQEDLMNAISLNNMGMNLFRIVAPAFTGFIIDAWDFAAVYYIMGALYILASIFLLPIRNTRTIVERVESTFHEIAEGLRYVRHERIIFLILMFTLSCTILGMPFNMLLPIFTEDILDVGASGQGLVMAVSGIGAIVVSFVLASMSNKKRGILMLLSGIILSISLVVFSFNTIWILSLVTAVFIGLGQTGQMAIGMTLIQYYVDPVYRGRAMSVQMLGFGMSSLGAVFGGVMAETLGAEWSIGGLAMVLGVVSTLILIFSPRLRTLD